MFSRSSRGGFLFAALAGVVFVASATVDGPVTSVLSLRPLVAVGMISYGLYLWHWPVFLYFTHARTGLTGTYDLKLEATPEWRIDSNPDPNEVSIFTAVKEQLGLKLEAQKAMIEILVVDHVEKPSAN